MALITPTEREARLAMRDFESGLPALNIAPKDPAGAGDSLFTSASMALCAGVDIWRASYLGALAAACQVRRVGNLPVTAADIQAEIDGGEM